MAEVDRLPLGGGSFKRLLHDNCLEEDVSNYPDCSDELLPEDAGIACDLCKAFGDAYISKIVRETPILKIELSSKITETPPIEGECLCSWKSCCESMCKCQGCDHSPENIANWLDDTLKILKSRPKSTFRPKVVSGDVGSSFGRGDEM